MISIFISGRNRETILPFLTVWPNSASKRIRLVPYGQVHRLRSIDPGLFLFADVDRITPGQQPAVEALQGQLTTHFGEECIINMPSWVLHRFDLLMLLWRAGINDFRPYSWDERETVSRFPVFVRRANDHSGPRSPLIYDSQKLREECQRLGKVWRFRNRLIVVEYCETRGDDGLYRKYSAFRIGERIIPGHIIFLSDWVAKDHAPAPMRGEERSYLEENPHRDELMSLFRLAGIEYGRIDYSLKDGAIVVWEINTNPVLIGEKKNYAAEVYPLKQELADQLAAAFLAAEETSDNHKKTGTPLHLLPQRRAGMHWSTSLDALIRPVHL